MMPNPLISIETLSEVINSKKLNKIKPYLIEPIKPPNSIGFRHLLEDKMTILTLQDFSVGEEVRIKDKEYLEPGIASEVKLLIGKIGKITNISNTYLRVVFHHLEEDVITKSRAAYGFLLLPKEVEKVVYEKPNRSVFTEQIDSFMCLE